MTATRNADGEKGFHNDLGKGSNLRVGRFHTPLGYYTTEFPHGGSIYRLATTRPRFLSMEMGESVYRRQRLFFGMVWASRPQCWNWNLDMRLARRCFVIPAIPGRRLSQVLSEFEKDGTEEIVA
jgi:hypothetical protein